jgi:hypothetical protein
MEKYCAHCKTTKPLNMFHKSKNKPFGRHDQCKECRKLMNQTPHSRQVVLEARKRYYQKHKKTIRSKDLFKRFGITLDDYNRILKEQNDSCKICSTHLEAFKKGLHVDHCHKTGKVRGILCTNCNTGLGMFKDNPELLTLAISYLG